jgi:vacuolar-type H+-ATPase subunit C/Vma6
MTTMMHPEAWTFLSGRVAVLETRLPTRDLLLDMAEWPPENLLAALGETDFGTAFTSEDDLAHEDALIDRFEQDLILELAEDMPEPTLGECATLERDWRNFKAFARHNLFGADLILDPASTLDAEALKVVWEAPVAGAPQSWSALAAEVRTLAERDKAFAEVFDAVLDHRHLVRLKELAAATHSPEVVAFTDALVHWRAVEVVVRTRLDHGDRQVVIAHFLQPPLDDDNLLATAEAPDEEWLTVAAAVLPQQVVEALSRGRRQEGLVALGRHIDKVLGDRLEPARFTVFGPERVFAYLVLLRAAARNLKIVVGGRLNHINPALLTERLRWVYA